MKKLIMILSAFLFANQANADKYTGYKAEVIMMYGEIIKTIDVLHGMNNDPSSYDANYHVRLTLEAASKARRATALPPSPRQGIYVCLVDYNRGKESVEYTCVRGSSTNQ